MDLGQRPGQSLRDFRGKLYGVSEMTHLPELLHPGNSEAQPKELSGIHVFMQQDPLKKGIDTALAAAEGFMA